MCLFLINNDYINMFIKIWLQIELVINMFKEFQQLKTPVEIPSALEY